MIVALERPPRSTFRSKAVRDLAWIMSSPNILDQPESLSDQWSGTLSRAALPWLTSIDADDSALCRWLAEQRGEAVGQEGQHEDQVGAVRVQVVQRQHVRVCQLLQRERLTNCARRQGASVAQPHLLERDQLAVLAVDGTEDLAEGALAHLLEDAVASVRGWLERHRPPAGNAPRHARGSKKDR